MAVLVHQQRAGQILQQRIIPVGVVRAQRIPASLHDGAVMSRVLQVNPKDPSLRWRDAACHGWQLARQQAQQCGFASAFVATDPTHASGPAVGEVLDGTQA